MMKRTMSRFSEFTFLIQTEKSRHSIYHAEFNKKNEVVLESVANPRKYANVYKEMYASVLHLWHTLLGIKRKVWDPLFL